MPEQPVVGWSDATSPPTPDQRRVRILRFPSGSRWVIVMLGDPVERHVHYDKKLEKSVPCHELRRRIPEDAVSTCPMCNHREWIGTRRSEGFAPVMVRNQGKRQWEQAVAVFTQGGLNQLDECPPAPSRGRVFVVSRDQQGRSHPMQVEEKGQVHPDAFPTGLPATFSVKPIMLQVWCPDRIPNEPIRFIDPVPFPPKENRRAGAPTEREVMDVPAEFLDQLKAHGLHRTAAKLEAEKRAAAQPPAPEPRPAPPARRPAAARRASPGDSPESPPPSDTPVSLPTAVTPLEAPEAGPTLDGLDGVISMRDILTRVDGIIICMYQSNRIPSTHPASRNGHHTTGAGKGGDQ